MLVGRMLRSAPYWLLQAQFTRAAGCLHFVRLLIPLHHEHCDLERLLVSVLHHSPQSAANLIRGMVSIPFHQVVRATTPLVTMGLYRVLYGRTYTRATCLSLIPVILGVAFATFGDYSYTTWSFLVTFLGVVLGAFKVRIEPSCRPKDLPADLLTDHYYESNHDRQS